MSAIDLENLKSCWESLKWQALLPISPSIYLELAKT